MITQELLHRLEKGDEKAREQIWIWLHENFWDYAYKLSYDRDIAHDAIQDTTIELENRVKSHKFEWRGIKDFEGYIRTLIYRKVRDMKNKLKRTIPIDPSEIRKIINELKDLKDEDRARDSIAKVKMILESTELILEKQHKYALSETVSAIHEYLFAKLKEALPPHAKSLEKQDEVLEAFDLNMLDFDKRDLYRFVERKLGISSSTLYVRLKRIREINLSKRGSNHERVM